MHLALAAIVCVLAACTGSNKTLRAENVSADRANPTRIELEDRGSKSATSRIKAGAPGAGTWWYVVETPQPAGSRVTFELATSYGRGKPGKVTFALVTDDKTIAATTSPGSRVARLVLPETADAPTRYTIQVTTTEATRFEVHVTSTWQVDVVVPPEPEPPPPVTPTRCADLNRPDFHDPACCRARCTFGDLKCRSKVISGGGRSATIALSARDEIMAYAKGWLYMNNSAVSEVIVTHVGETESSIQIMSPDDVDMTKLVASGMVILSPPAACKR